MNCSRNDDGPFTTLCVRGELDAVTVAEFRPILDKLIDDQRRQVNVDLSELRLVDSSGVGALVSLYKRVRAIGGSVEFAGVKAQPLVIFKLLRLDVVFELSSNMPVPEIQDIPASIRVLRT